MIVRTPKSRFDLEVKRNDFVLEVGSGHDPNPKADVIVDKFLDSNYHRSDNIKKLKNQSFRQADGQNLPFENKSFDYAINTHVLEHVEDPASFLKEQFRVARRGYFEAPSLLGEFLVPKASHRWVMLFVKGELVLFEKDKIGMKNSHDFGNFFLDYMPKHSLAYKLLQRTYGDILTVRAEWKGEFPFLVNPFHRQDLVDLFTKPWQEEDYNLLFPKKTYVSELIENGKAFGSIIKSVVKSKVFKKYAITAA